MLALTLKHPWPWAVKVLGKRLENRTWKPSFRMTHWKFAIHGGKRPTSKSDLMAVKYTAVDLIQRFRDRITGPVPLGDVILPGIVAVAKFGGVVTESDDPWFQGPYGWLLEDVVVLPEPVPCRGAQGLWTLPDDVSAEVRAQLQEVAV